MPGIILGALPSLIYLILTIRLRRRFCAIVISITGVRFCGGHITKAQQNCHTAIKWLSQDSNPASLA